MNFFASVPRGGFRNTSPTADFGEVKDGESAENLALILTRPRVSLCRQSNRTATVEHMDMWETVRNQADHSKKALARRGLL